MNIKGSGLEGKKYCDLWPDLKCCYRHVIALFFLVKLSHERAIKLKDVLATLGEGFIS